MCVFVCSSAYFVGWFSCFLNRCEKEIHQWFGGDTYGLSATYGGIGGEEYEMMAAVYHDGERYVVQSVLDRGELIAPPLFFSTAWVLRVRHIFYDRLKFTRSRRWCTVGCTMCCL